MVILLHSKAETRVRRGTRAIPARMRQRQEGQMIKASLGYTGN